MSGRDTHVGAALVVAGFFGLILLVGVLSYFFGRGCQSKTIEIETGIDAGPGGRAIDEALDGAAQAAEARRIEIERAHAEALAAFNEQQRTKYEALRDDPEAADEFIRNFTREMRARRP
jgi:hypothetical protein